MVLPIIFNLRQRRRRRTEHRGLRLVDHADQLTKTKTAREMKGEKFENGRDKKNRPPTTKASGKATRLIRKMLLSPLNHASL